MRGRFRLRQPDSFTARLLLFVCAALFVTAAGAEAAADKTAERRQAYLERNFGDDIPGSQSIWIKGPLKDQVADILQHKPRFLRARYWTSGDRSVWILEEVGKTKPITFGITVIADRITDFEVLMFRESRGWEIEHDFFKQQFTGASNPQDSTSLDRKIDGITGATLSVRASIKMARIALLLAKEIKKGQSIAKR